MGRKLNLELPPRMRARKKANNVLWYYFDTGGAPRIEIPLGNNFDKAMIEYSFLISKIAKFNNYTKSGSYDFLYQRAKKGATNRKVDFYLTFEDVAKIIKRANYRCELTGIKFDFRKVEGLRIRPWIPSIDRIDNSNLIHWTIADAYARQ